MLASWLCFLVAPGTSFRYLTTLTKWTTLETQEITGSGFRERKIYEKKGIIQVRITALCSCGLRKRFGPKMVN